MPNSNENVLKEIEEIFGSSRFLSEIDRADDLIGCFVVVPKENCREVFKHILSLCVSQEFVKSNKRPEALHSIGYCEANDVLHTRWGQKAVLDFENAWNRSFPLDRLSELVCTTMDNAFDSRRRIAFLTYILIFSKKKVLRGNYL